MTNTKQIDDGGLAFPGTRWQQVGTVADHGFADDDTPTYADVSHPGMSLRDYFAAHAPEPSKEDVQAETQRDRNRNPHNDYHKPRLRGRIEIIAALMFEYADAMIAARKGGAA